MDAKEILHEQERMASKRSNFDNQWQEVAEFVAPEYAVFTARTDQGQEKHRRIFDTTAAKALRHYGAIMNTMLTPRNREWHKLRAKDDNLKDSVDVSRWLENATKRIFALRYAPTANFASQMDTVYMMDGLVGNSCLYVDGDVETGMRYKNIHPKEIYVKPNHQGLIDQVNRFFILKGYQAVKMFNPDDLPEVVRKDSAKDQEFNFVHCVKRNPDFDPRSLRPEKRKFISYYACKEGEKIISIGGYRTMPYIYNRHDLAPDEDYGRSPAMRMLPTIKMINEKARTILRAGQMAVQPPMMFGDLTNVQPFNIRPGAANYGYILNDGRAMAQPLNTGTRPDIGVEMLDMDRKDIEAEFFVNLYNILVETPNMTATEVMQRVQEKAQLLAPVTGRKQSELLGPLITREIDVMASMFGIVDDLPEELQGDAIEFEYDTEMTRSMRADEGSGIMRSLEVAMQVAQADPSVLDIFDMSELMRELSQINGVPAKVMRTVEQIQEMKEQQAQQQQMQQAAEMANKAAPAIQAAGNQGIL